MITSGSRFDNFISQKKSLTEALIELTNLFEVINNSFVDKPYTQDIKALKGIADRIKVDSFKVLVVGEFSTGKSTFINALLSNNILPTDDNETTATINIIRYGENPEIEIFFDDSPTQVHSTHERPKSIKIAIEKLKDYTTSLTKESNELAQLIKEAIIKYPLDFCKDGVEIIDTPGLNSTIGYHEETTLNYLSNGHCAIILLKATQLFTKSELVYLKKFYRYFNKIFFVVNKIDLLKSDFYSNDAKKSRLIKLKKELGREEDFNYFLVSSIKAVTNNRSDSGIDDFIIDFKDFLASGGKAKEMLISPVIQSLEIIGLLKNNLSTVLACLSFTPHEFNVRIKELSPKLVKLKAKIQELNTYVEIKHDTILLNYEKTFNDQLPSFLKSINDFILNYSNALEELEADLKNQVRIGLTNFFQDLEVKLKPFIDSLSNEVNIRYSDYIESIKLYKSEINNSKIIQPYQHDVSNINFANENIELGIMRFGAAFGIGYLSTLLILGPIGWVVGVLGSILFSDYLEDKQRQKTLNKLADKVVSDLEFRLSTSIPDGKKNLSGSINLIKKSINIRMEDSLNSVNRTLEAIKNEKELKQKEHNSRKLEITNFINELNTYESILINLKNKGVNI